jgi:hypothetical protein
MKAFAIEIFKQLFGFSSSREDKIILTNHALSRMYEYGLDERTIKDVFRNGKKKRPGMIIQRYYEYAVGIYYKYEGGKYLITTCWKGGER